MTACDSHLLTKTCDAHLQKAAPVRTRVATYVVKHQAKLAKKILSVFRQQASTCKALVRRMGKADLSEEDHTMIEDLLAQIEESGVGVAIVDELTPEIEKAFKDAGIYGVAQVGINGSAGKDITKQLDPLAAKYAEERGGELIKDLADTTIEDLRSVLEQGVEDGLSTDELADQIDELGAFGEARADMIARTELAMAHVEGNVEGWRQTGEVSGKRSILGDLHDKEDECDDCADAGVVDLEDEFIPGYDFPPYHPNCVCDIVPVLSNSEGED